MSLIARLPLRLTFRPPQYVQGFFTPFFVIIVRLASAANNKAGHCAFHCCCWACCSWLSTVWPLRPVCPLSVVQLLLFRQFVHVWLKPHCCCQNCPCHYAAWLSMLILQRRHAAMLPYAGYNSLRLYCRPRLKPMPVMTQETIFSVAAVHYAFICH